MPAKKVAQPINIPEKAMHPLILAFLDAYADYQGWTELPVPPSGWQALSHKLCQDYHYSPANGREFLVIAFGWMWGRSQETMPYIEANALIGLLKMKLDQVYAEVARENHWETS